MCVGLCFAIILTRKRGLVACFIVVWMSCYCKCPVALPQGAVGWSVVYDGGISCPYSLTFLCLTNYSQ